MSCPICRPGRHLRRDLLLAASAFALGLLLGVALFYSLAGGAR